MLLLLLLELFLYSYCVTALWTKLCHVMTLCNLYFESFTYLSLTFISLTEIMLSVIWSCSNFGNPFWSSQVGLANLCCLNQMHKNFFLAMRNYFMCERPRDWTLTTVSIARHIFCFCNSLCVTDLSTTSTHLIKDSINNILRSVCNRD